MRFAQSISSLAMLILVSCSPVEQEFEARSNKAHIAEDCFAISETTKLPSKRWITRKPKGIILAVHGFNDYSNAFELFAQDASKRGYSTYAYDQRGFGQNGHQGIWGGKENLAQDFCDIAHALKQAHPKKPLIILSESMGGSVVIHAASTCLETKPYAYVFSAPAAWGGDSMNPLYRIMLWTIAHTMPDKKFTGEELEIRATDNMEILRELSKDPNVLKATRADSIYGLQQLMDAAYDDIESNPLESIPTLVLYGERDEVIPPEPVGHVAKHVPHTDFYIFEHGYHMLLRDLQRKKVNDSIFAWLEEHLHD